MGTSYIELNVRTGKILQETFGKGTALQATNL